MARKFQVCLWFTCISSTMFPLSSASCISSMSRTQPNGESVKGHETNNLGGEAHWVSKFILQHCSLTRGKTPLEGKEISWLHGGQGSEGSLGAVVSEE